MSQVKKIYSLDLDLEKKRLYPSKLKYLSVLN